MDIANSFWKILSGLRLCYVAVKQLSATLIRPSVSIKTNGADAVCFGGGGRGGKWSFFSVQRVTILLCHHL